MTTDEIKGVLAVISGQTPFYREGKFVFHSVTECQMKSIKHACEKYNLVIDDVEKRLGGYSVRVVSNA